MGAQSSKKGLAGVVARDESKVGKLAVSGRYHRSPKKLEDDYKPLSKVLGSGYNGQVHLAESKQTGGKYAVKGFKLHGVGREKKEELESEAEIFLQMDHPHVCRLVDVYESEEQLDLVMECMSGGELFKRVTERKRFTEKDAADAAWQMLLALNYIHQHGIVHRDIKLENFLYEKEDSDHLKLIDFGFSKIWAPNTKMALSCGTLAYVAPEVLGRNYTSKCDLWSLGVTIFIVLFGYMPFTGTEEAQVRKIKDGRFTKKKDVWSRVSSKAQDFVEKLLVVDPEKRLSAHQALEHPWIAERDKMEQAHFEASLNEDVANSLIQFGQISAFRRACMEMMAWSLSNDERAQIRDAFIAIDKDRSGTITIQEFKAVLEDKFHIHDDATLQSFAALDTNHADEIHYTEFLAAMVSSRIQLHDDLLKATFRRFDTDNQGFITVKNLREVLGESFEGEEVEKMIAEADSSHDGKIDYKEWIEYLRGGDAMDHHGHAAMKIIDKEHDKAKAEGHPVKSTVKCRMKEDGAGGGAKAPEETKPKEEKKQGSCCGLQ
jgi:calcium-dependent protein kinase